MLSQWLLARIVWNKEFTVNGRKSSLSMNFVLRHRAGHLFIGLLHLLAYNANVRTLIDSISLLIYQLLVIRN